MVMMGLLVALLLLRKWFMYFTQTALLRRCKENLLGRGALEEVFYLRHGVACGTLGNCRAVCYDGGQRCLGYVEVYTNDKCRG
jgi:hypothetical protein